MEESTPKMVASSSVALVILMCLDVYKCTLRSPSRFNGLFERGGWVNM